MGLPEYILVVWSIIASMGVVGSCFAFFQCEDVDGVRGGGCIFITCLIALIVGVFAMFELSIVSAL